jgi:hypothetical protein
MKQGTQTPISPEAIQYTIRVVPADVDLVLRRRAADLKLSLNQVVLDELTRATLGRHRRSDFSELVGQWTPDPGFDEVIAAQRQIHWGKWNGWANAMKSGCP